MVASSSVAQGIVVGQFFVSIRRHALYNLLGALLPLGFSLVTIPIYLGLIGEARYGVLAIAWLLLGYFGLFDLGLGRATAQRIAALHAGTTAARARTFWTALSLNLGLGIVGGLLIWPVATYFFANVFEVEDVLRPEVQEAVPWLVLGVPMATLSGVLSGALQGRERFLELNLISVAGTALFQLLPLGAAAAWGADLGVLLPAALCARLLTLLVLLERCRRHVFLDHAYTFTRAQASALLSFGGWVAVTSLVGPMMVILDRMIIGAMSGAKAVTYYTVPFQLAERSTIISNALASAAFPRFAAASPQEQKRLAQEGLQALVVIMTPLVAVGILLIEPFLSWWIDPAFAQKSAVLGQILLLGFWVNGFARIPYAQLQASGRPDLVAKTHLAELSPYILILYFGLQTLDLVGAALAFSVRALADFALLSWLSGTLGVATRALLMPMLLLTVAMLIATQTLLGAPQWYVLFIGYLSISLAWAWLHAPLAIRSVVLVRFRAAAKRPTNHIHE